MSSLWARLFLHMLTAVPGTERQFAVPQQSDRTWWWSGPWMRVDQPWRWT